MCAWVLGNQGVEYAEDVCFKHMKLPSLKISNHYKSVAAKSLCKILNGHVSGSTKMTDPKAEKQRAIELEVMMLFNLHVTFAKKIGIDEERTICALIQQFRKCNSKFTNHRDLLNTILDLPKYRQTKAVMY